MKTPRQFGVIILQLTLIQQTVQTVHNLYKHQIIEVDLSDTIQAATGDFIPVSKLINMKVEGEYKQGQITILKHLTKYILTKETDQVVHVFSLVLKEEDKSSPVSGNLEASLEVGKYQTNTNTTTVSKTEEAIMKKHIASLYSRVTNLEKNSNTSESDEALASKTPNYSIFSPKILYSDTEIQSIGPKIASDFKSAKDSSDKYYTEADLTLEQCKNLEEEFNNRVLCLKMSDTVWIDMYSSIPVKDLAKARKGESLLTNGRPIQITKLNPSDFLKEPGDREASKFTLYIRPETASDNDEVVSDKGHWSKQPKHMAKKQSDTYINGIHLHKEMLSDSKTVQVDYTKAEQGIRIRSLERIEKVLTEQVVTLSHHKQKQESKIDKLEQEVKDLKSAIKHLNSKTDKILKLIFKD